MFKKREKTGKTIGIDDIEQDEHSPETNEQRQKVTMQSKKINRFNVKEALVKPPAYPPRPKIKQTSANQEKPQEARYGLIDKELQATKTYNDMLMDMYVKQKMKELAQYYLQKTESFNTAYEVLKIQRKYLKPTESKIASYDTGELRKKYVTMSIEIIRTEQEKRRYYLKNLLYNELYRIEYASKKQLKEIRQERERDYRYLTVNYRQEGRRYMVNSIKREVLHEAIKK